MRLYLPKYIERESYRRIVSVIYDYPRLKEEYNMIGSMNMSVTKRTEYQRKITAYEDAFNKLDSFQQELIREHFFRRIKFDNCSYPGSSKTMSRQVRMFIILLGISLGELE